LAVDKVLFARGDYTKSLMLLWLRILLDRRIAIPQYQVSNGGTPPHSIPMKVIDKYAKLQESNSRNDNTFHNQSQLPCIPDLRRVENCSGFLAAVSAFAQPLLSPLRDRTQVLLHNLGRTEAKKEFQPRQHDSEVIQLPHTGQEVRENINWDNHVRECGSQQKFRTKRDPRIFYQARK